MNAASFNERLRKIAELGEALRTNQEKMARQAAREIKFTLKDSRREVLTTIQRLGMYEGTRSRLEGRKPLGGEGSTVALMLSYNGSAWLNIAVTSIVAAGSRVLVKFSSKGSGLSELTESIYKPIFGNQVQFTRIGGWQFMENSLKDPNVSSIVVFGSDATVLPYEEAVRKSGKKLIFEGPGQDPFIVFSDADIELALSDLMVSKFLNNGQACIAAKRIFIHRPIYDSFLREFEKRTSRLVVGDPENEKTDISPVISDLAVDRIKLQLKEAVEKGARIILGGRIEGNLIYPTIVRDATDDMLGMRKEVFGPVAFTTLFDSMEEVILRAKDNQYGLRAAVFGGREAEETAQALIGEEYCHPVSAYTFGKFGTVALNETRTNSWRGAFITKPVGGYGLSGWIWETVDGIFRMKQGPKLLSVETSTEVEA
jgi:succinate-semialdehyde dehydrogenase/glutarate-semialdehyde dehydrogenase